MTLVYYNTFSDSIYVIESDEMSSLGMYFVLDKKSRHNGWIFLGEL